MHESLLNCDVACYDRDGLYHLIYLYECVNKEQACVKYCS